MDDAGSRSEEEYGGVEHERVARRKPSSPSKRERELHEASHIPFRSWCESCVAGRGRAKRHVAGRHEPANKLHFDYFFSGDDAKTHPVLVCHDELTGDRLARLMPHTGVTGNASVIADIVTEPKEWGHGHCDDTPLVFMSDGEPAIQAFKRRLMQELPGRNTEEVAAKHQSASNGWLRRLAKPRESTCAFSSM